MFISVVPDIGFGKRRQIGLEFKAADRDLRMAIGHDKADDAAAATKVEDPLSSLRWGEMGGQNGIHRKTVAIPRLPADQTAGEEGVIGRFDGGVWSVGHRVYGLQ